MQKLEKNVNKSVGFLKFVWNENFIEGIFIDEVLPRFIGKAKIEGKTEEIYIASSAKLSNYIYLKGQNIILEKNKKKSKRTRYTLCFLKIHNNFIIMNLSKVNNIFAELYQLNMLIDYSYKGLGKIDVKIEDYKPDYYIENSKIIIENKTIISNNEEASFPSETSKRFVEQLERLEKLQDLGYEVHLNIFVLTPWTKTITLNIKAKKYIIQFRKNFQKGLKIHYYKLYYSDNVLVVNIFNKNNIFM